MKYTFGKTAAAQKLEVLLKDKPLARRRISSLLSDYTNQLLLIAQARDPRTVRVCMALLRDYTLRRLDVKNNLTPEVKSYSQNVVVARYRAFQRGFETVSKLLKVTEGSNNKKKS